MVMRQEPVACRRSSSKVQIKVEEEGAGRERNGRTTLPSGQGRALPRPKPLSMTVRGGDRGELCHDPSPCPLQSEGKTGKSFATTQALPMTVRGGDREELYHDPSPCPLQSEGKTGKSFATTQALAHDSQRSRQLVQRSSMLRPHHPGKG